MDCSVTDIGGEVLAISQFTLTAGTRKGNRPSYIRAAGGAEAEPLYRLFCELLEARIGRRQAAVCSAPTCRSVSQTTAR